MNFLTLCILLTLTLEGMRRCITLLRHPDTTEFERLMFGGSFLLLAVVIGVLVGIYLTTNHDTSAS